MDGGIRLGGTVLPPLAGAWKEGEALGGCRVGAPKARAKARRAGGAGGGIAPKRRC